MVSVGIPLGSGRVFEGVALIGSPAEAEDGPRRVVHDQRCPLDVGAASHVLLTGRADISSTSTVHVVGPVRDEISEVVSHGVGGLSTVPCHSRLWFLVIERASAAGRVDVRVVVVPAAPPVNTGSRLVAVNTGQGIPAGLFTGPRCHIRGDVSRVVSREIPCRLRPMVSLER